MGPNHSGFVIRHSFVIPSFGIVPYLVKSSPGSDGLPPARRKFNLLPWSIETWPTTASPAAVKPAPLLRVECGRIDNQTGTAIASNLQPWLVAIR